MKCVGPIQIDKYYFYAYQFEAKSVPGAEVSRWVECYAYLADAWINPTTAMYGDGAIEKREYEDMTVPEALITFIRHVFQL